MLSNPILIFGAIVFVIVGLVLLYAKPVYAFPLFFLLLFFESVFLPGSRQRVLITFQIVYFLGYIITYVLRIIGRHETFRTSNWVISSMLLCMFSQIVFSIIGYLNGYNTTDILINNYKFIEIFLFYFVISTSVRSTNEMKKLLRVLFILAMILGVIELITTTRGGVGLLILMNFGTVFFSDNLLGSKKHWKLFLIVSSIIVVFSQSRSYMIAYLLSLIISYSFFPSNTRKKTLLFTLPFAAAFVISIIVFSESTRVSLLLSRLARLEEGLDVAGGYRWAEFQVALSKFLEKPFGRGFGFLDYLYIRGIGYLEWGDYAHIITGEILLKTGIFGALLYFYLTFKTASLGYMHISDAWQENDSTLLAVCIGGFAGLIGRIVLYNMSAHSTYGYLFLPIAFSDVYYRLYMREAEEDHLVEYETGNQTGILFEEARGEMKI